MLSHQIAVTTNKHTHARSLPLAVWIRVRVVFDISKDAVALLVFVCTLVFRLCSELSFSLGGRVIVSKGMTTCDMVNDILTYSAIHG